MQNHMEPKNLLCLVCLGLGQGQGPSNIHLASVQCRPCWAVTLSLHQAACGSPPPSGSLPTLSSLPPNSSLPCRAHSLLHCPVVHCGLRSYPGSTASLV